MGATVTESGMRPSRVAFPVAVFAGKRRYFTFSFGFSLKIRSPNFFETNITGIPEKGSVRVFPESTAAGKRYVLPPISRVTWQLSIFGWVLKSLIINMAAAPAADSITNAGLPLSFPEYFGSSPKEASSVTSPAVRAEVPMSTAALLMTLRAPPHLPKAINVMTTPNATVMTADTVLLRSKSTSPTANAAPVAAESSSLRFPIGSFNSFPVK